MAAITTKNLCKNYGQREIVKDLNLTVETGEIYGLIGKNGAGKTTLIRMITGIALPTSGEIGINGKTHPEGLLEERRRIGSLIDQPSLIPYLSGLNNMKQFAYTLGIDDEEELCKCLEFVGLNPYDKLKVKNYSLGMKQRLAIAVALIDSPDILILDEPVNGLDPMGMYEMRELIIKLNKTKGVTVLISSHLLGELGKMADAYGIMENGKLVREIRGADLQNLSRPFIKVVVADMKRAVGVLAENFSAHQFEILPFKTIAVYDLERGVGETAKLFTDAGVPVVSISQQEGDLETAFITMMGGSVNEK